jgi:hypothetical protein
MSVLKMNRGGTVPEPYLELDTKTARIFLALNRYVMTGADTSRMTSFARENLQEIRDQLLQRPDIDIDSLPDIAMIDFVKLPCPEKALQVLTISSLIEGNRDDNNAIISGTINTNNIAPLFTLAQIADIDDLYIQILKQIYNGDIQKAIDALRIININKQSTGQIQAIEELNDTYFPYKSGPDETLSAKFDRLKNLKKNTLGYQFWCLAIKSDNLFPGEIDAFDFHLSTFRDTSHLLSGYDTSQGGQLYNSTFSQLADNTPALSWKLLPSLLRWQLGYTVFNFTSPSTDIIDISLFWEAWMRGYHSKSIHFADKDWDFWAYANTPLETIKQLYGIPPLRSDNFEGKIKPVYKESTCLSLTPHGLRLL